MMRKSLYRAVQLIRKEKFLPTRKFAIRNNFKLKKLFISESDMIGIGDMNLTIRNRNRKLFYEMLSTSSSPKTNNFVYEFYFTHCPHFRLNSPNKTQYSVIDH